MQKKSSGIFPEPRNANVKWKVHVQEPVLTPSAAILPLKYLWTDNETALSRRKKKNTRISLRNEEAFYYQSGRACGKLDTRQNESLLCFLCERLLADTSKTRVDMTFSPRS